MTSPTHCRIPRHPLRTALSLATLMLLPVASAAADCSYTVRGTVSVEHQIDELADSLGTSSPLENIQVKVSAKVKVLGVWATWGEWDTVRTGSTGSFSVSKSKSCADRRFKVEVKFDDDDLEIRHENATSSLTKVKWYTVLEETSGSHASSTSSVDLGDFVFESGGDEDLGEFEPRRHADIWVLYHLAFDEMAGMGRSFNDKVKIKYPHNGIAGDEPEESYSNPLNNVIYIEKNSDDDDGDDPETLLHELMHVWMYQHSQGEDALAGYLITHLTRGTHDLVDKTYVAFHEGFAEYGMDILMSRLFGTDIPAPYSREGLADRGMTSLDLVQYMDLGWLSIFRIMNLTNLCRYEFDTTSSRVQDRDGIILKTEDVTQMSFANLVDVFDLDSSAGYSEDIHRDEMNFDDFFTRAEDILSDFGSADTSTYLDLVDPDSALEPYDDICTSMVVHF
ncbi:MAG: hypothetical protein HYV63_32605 [Candidatus Schekmanbacteria bacterium]|nr:hypothetical protein [Candidatus Schekmanbacteria bacterium]